jgi:hypothetical protein
MGTAEQSPRTRAGARVLLALTVADRATGLALRATNA